MPKERNELYREMYLRMHQARKFEEKVAFFFSRGMVHGTTHLSVGQEASAVAACMALKDDDLVSSTHRGHSQVIGKGIDLNRMMAELLGKATGYCKGKGGSMHIADLERGNIGANGVVGGGYGLSAGAALTQKYLKTGRIVLCFSGDGATNEGNFHESLNMASVWKLPVIYLVENNMYGMSMSVERHMNIPDIAVRAQSYGIPGRIVDGNDAVAVYEAVSEAAKYVREGNGPILIESKTYRWLGHSKSDANVYRTKEEIEAWKLKCPIKAFGTYLVTSGHVTEQELIDIEEHAKAQIDAAVMFAEQSEMPGLETLTEDVYA